MVKGDLKKTGLIEIQRLPVASRLPLASAEISARPAGSSATKLHQFPHGLKGAR
jgi:hypothetical protein